MHGAPLGCIIKKQSSRVLLISKEKEVTVTSMVSKNNKQSPHPDKPARKQPKKQKLNNDVKSFEKKGPTVVGIGASAGGLKALQTFFEALPSNTGMAFVVVTHLHPEHESHLAEIL